MGNYSERHILRSTITVTLMFCLASATTSPSLGANIRQGQQLAKTY